MVAASKVHGGQVAGGHRGRCSGGRVRDDGAGGRRQFTLPAVPGVLDSRELLVNVFDPGGGQSAIDVNAEVRWRSNSAQSREGDDGNS